MDNITFRKAQLQDLDQIMILIQMAKDYFKLKNSIQWQGGYPAPSDIIQDIQKGQSYLLELQGKVVATAAITYGENQDYKIIENGKWMTEGTNYFVIHRIAVDTKLKRRGFGTILMKHAQKLGRQQNANSLRVDTKTQNKEMIELAKKNGYEFCGHIFVEGGFRNQAFQRVLKPKQNIPTDTVQQ